MSDNVRQLGRYELLYRIAKGGMGEIYLAKTRGTAGFEKNVVIKTILPHLAEEPEFVEKFLDEGRTVVQLGHGNIVPVFDMGEEEGEYFIAMEYIPGRDLREVMKRLTFRNQSFPINFALYVAVEVAKGLSYAHRKTDQNGTSLGIVHRDVSPSNVLLSSEGEVKVIDFGIARATTRLSKTVSGRIQGKFCYMSPEQASGKPLNAKSDVFSLGSTLYEMLTGFRPFEGDTDLESLDMVRRCEVDPPSTLNAKVSAEVDEIIAKALAKAPGDRYESAEAMQVDLLQYLYSSGTAPTGSDLSRFLTGLFEEGLEIRELRKARGSGSSQKKLSLDDALDLGIDALLDQSGGFNIDPHSTTAISEATDDGTPAKSHTATHFETPSSTSSRSVDLPVPVPQEQSKYKSKRAIVISVLSGLLVGIVGVVWAIAQPAAGKVTIESTPSGASIWVDDARVVDAKTPHTMELEEGAHQIRLEHESFEPQRMRVNVESDKPTLISKEQATLVPKTQPRDFQITPQPLTASIFRDGELLGTGPQIVRLDPAGVANLRAESPKCRTATYTLSFTHAAEKVSLPLDCDAADTEPVEVAPDTNPTETEPKESTPKILKMRFDSRPSGAQISVNGKALGTGPISREYKPTAVLDVSMKLDGFKEVRQKKKALRWGRSVVLTLERAPQGCVDISLVRPSIGEVKIDGDGFFAVERSRSNIKLSAGPHTIRARNNPAEKDETRNIIVKPGDKCDVVIFFDE